MLAAQLLEVVVAQVVAVEQDAAFVRVVQAREQLHQRGLAGAVLADQRQHLAGMQREATGGAPPSARRPDSGSRRPRTRNPRGSARGNGTGIARRADLRLDLEEREQVVEVERLSCDLREADQQSFEQVAQAPERAGEERQVADAEFAVQRAPGDVRIRGVIGERADGGQRAAPARAAQREPAVGREERLSTACGSGRSGSALRPKILTSLAVSTLAPVWRT